MNDVPPDPSSATPLEHSPIDPAETSTRPPGRLLKRTEAARLLGVSTATVRRMEGSTLTPVLGPDGVHRFQEEHVHEVRTRWRATLSPERSDAYDAESAATRFELFDEGGHPVDVVKRTKLHPHTVVAIHRQWVSMRGGYVVRGEVARKIAGLQWLQGARPICSGDDLLKCLSQTAPHACNECQQNIPELCAECAERLSVNDAKKKAAEARLRQEVVLTDRTLSEWDTWQFPSMRRKQRKAT